MILQLAESSETPQKNDAQPSMQQPKALALKLEILEKERQRERDHMQATIDGLRARLDRSEDHISALLSAPP